MSDSQPGPASGFPHPLTEEAIAQAIERGMIRAVSSDAFWESASKAMKRQAQSTAGSLLFGWIKTLWNKFSLVMLGLLALYWVGGWAGVVAFLKAQAVSK